ncbi:pentapeptide repeat-containing protein [Streptomyces parvus]|uniref:pentapeptide repeat-containing protein n=1 Tax=Streptomyces parvus TaxID=66428 RepID=UPI003724BF8C
MVAAVVAVAGLWYSNVQTRQANEQAREDRALAKEGQITDRYTAAVGNLGEDKMDVRLGGIYALQRIMQDSHRDQPTITNVLATYVRTHAAKPPAKDQDVPADVLAALTVLTTRETSRVVEGTLPLNLGGVQLPGINIGTEGSLPAELDETDLTGANLTGADLSHAKLARAGMVGADLRNASLSGADLSGADLSGADLRGADLRAAKLHETYLSGADLRGAIVEGDLDSSFTDSSTRF